MSIENAILELAAAIRHLADSNREIAATGGAPLGTGAEVLTKEQRDAELETAVAKVEQATKPTTAKAAIADALARAKADKAKNESTTGTQSEQSQGAGQGSDDLTGGTAEEVKELDYAKDVQPLLVAVGKNRDELVALLSEYGAKNGAGIKKSDYPAVVADCNKILSARG